jgi:hypothetical protein
MRGASARRGRYAPVRRGDLNAMDWPFKGAVFEAASKRMTALLPVSTFSGCIGFAHIYIRFIILKPRSGKIKAKYYILNNTFK